MSHGARQHGGGHRAKYTPGNPYGSPSSAAAPSVPPAGAPVASPTPATTGRPSDMRVQQMNEKLQNVRNVMTENMQRTIERGQQLEEIEAKSDVLLVDSSKFQSSAQATRRMFCRRHWRNVLMVCLIVALLLGLIIWWAS